MTKRYFPVDSTTDQLLHRYQVGQKVSDLDYDMIASLWSNSSIWYQMSNTPTLFVGKLGRKGKCFYATDGLKTVPLSSNYYHPQKELSQEKKVKQAMRSAVRPQIDKLLNDTTWPAVCPITGKVFAKKDRHLYHVDHSTMQPNKHTFSVILASFLREKGMRLQEVCLSKGYLIKDLTLETEWQSYHSQHSDLVVVDAVANMKKGSKRDAPLWQNLTN